jgi:hypothetical protein
MLGNIARGAFLLMLAVMIVSWAITISNSKPADPQPEPAFGWMYS